jgi:GGDEF domain-containing protein
MKRGLALVYTLVTVVFFIAVAAVLLFRLGQTREENLVEARAGFEQLQREVERVTENTDLTTSRAVQEAFRASASQSDRIAAFAAYGIQDNIQYLWARNRRVLDETSEEAPRFTYDRVSQARLSGSVRLPDGAPLMVEGIYTVLDRRDIFALLRDALIAVLAFALLAVILAVISLLRPTPAAGEKPREATAKQPAGLRKTTSAPPRSRPTERAPTGTRTAPTADARAREHRAGQPSVDAGLFSPQSGLSPESHLEKRLSLELERAASNDQDLSICFIEYPSLARGSQTYRDVAAALLEFFGFEDLIFEYGKSGFCVIFPNVDLTEAIGLVESFQRRGRDSEDGSEAAPPRAAGVPAFGLSSRNGRLVEGGRLMREARQALAKARDLPGRIMGFRPDPQRYRRYLSETE